MRGAMGRDIDDASPDTGRRTQLLVAARQYDGKNWNRSRAAPRGTAGLCRGALPQSDPALWARSRREDRDLRIRSVRCGIDVGVFDVG
ncbi:hypothetical protein GCM10010449_62650 [Streptomyces rectiviolaceus]|uniref:Transposase n=1 Tax=Streptomyces rectiviolaceus TaxID=332591 RepID=A0ABP6N1Z7_9ACTN